MSQPQFSPQFLAEDISARLVAASSIILVVTTILIALRLYIRRLPNVKTGLEDILLFIAYILQVGACITGLLAVIYGGAGRHVMALKPATIVVRSKLLYALSWLTAYSNCFSRVSVLVLLYKIFTPGLARKCSVLLIIYMVLFVIAQSIAGALECTPISDLWNPHPVGSCIKLFLFFKMSGILNIFGDLAILVLPTYTVWNLHASLARRAGIALVFLSGSIGIIASCFRTASFFTSHKESKRDPTWADVQLMSWTIVESGMYTCAACIMRLRPLLRNLMGWFKQFKTTYGSHGTTVRAKTTQDGKARELKQYSTQGHVPLISFERDLNRVELSEPAPTRSRLNISAEKMVSTAFPLPDVVHGNRILTTVIEIRAKDSTTEPWVSVPVNNNDLSAGFRDITFQQLNNAANHAARWLNQTLPQTSEPFQAFAYAGPKDLRYAFLAVAAAKLQKVIVLPSPLLTADAQLRILEKTKCKLYLRPSEVAGQVDSILQKAPHIVQITVPGTEEFLRDDEAAPLVYSKTWDEGKDDPWLVFHTSGTTGHPKPITYSHRMMAGVDTAASLPNIQETHIHQYAQRRWYTPLPSLHFVGMLMSLAMTGYMHMTCVVGPPSPPAPQLLVDIFRYGKIDGALLMPVLIDALCLFPEGLQALRELKYIHYAGAPLSTKSGNLLAPYTSVIPCVGSTEAGGYFTSIHEHKEAWEYLSFQQDAGAEFHPRIDALHELVFIRRPECAMQQIFHVYPDRQTFETSDLWTEHPEHKGLWKIIGRSDDYVYLAHADGLHASLLEPSIIAHPSVKSALIGGHGRLSPVLLVELVPGAESNDPKQLKKSLEPYIEKVNEQCHDAVKLSSERLIFAKEEKPFILTVKGSVARVQTLALYEPEIAALFE
ncbi:putative NRPS-like protein biosynthetic cluster [Myotisia sp. PD_48]|nr:putative NRPS-like protein biosynthetic cluster [Myotisia sp. PD_48]